MMIWEEPIIVRLADRQGASGAATCEYGGQAGYCNSGSAEASQSCAVGGGATEGCGFGMVAGASGTYCGVGGSAS